MRFISIEVVVVLIGIIRLACILRVVSIRPVVPDLMLSRNIAVIQKTE